ncbi:hypothetical protein [Stappia sp. TSB10GB4]|uniref:hypothetical protein n=1 Tax=Stappia sp. TSB10GB4 TaxID=2003584 RepID=UPI0016474C8E|nr:hypothetical protein [Stappia sp. TSB10GB4]
MSLIGKTSGSRIGSSFGSTKKLSAYQQMQQWRTKQRERSETLERQNAISSNLFAVGISETQTATEMLFNNVAARVKKEAQAKLAQQSEAIDSALDAIEEQKTNGVDIKV